MGSRRDFIKQGSLVGLAGAISPLETLASVQEVSPRQKGKTKWLDGSRLVVWRFALIFGSSMQQN